jgi:lauroyl/myristoyl acyltransferase
MSDSADLAVALAEARRPAQPPPMPHVGPLLALMTSRRLHRLLPKPLAARAGAAHGWVAWHASASVRERANATMQAIVGGTGRAHEAGTLARLHVIDGYAERMLFWQPPAPASVDERSLANLRAALSSGRGVAISACHLGPFYDVTACVSILGRSTFVVAGQWFFDPPSLDYRGRHIAHWWRRTTARNNRLVRASNSFAALQALLEEGEVALIYFDTVGSHQTTFLGKPTALSSGTARLALASGALVLPVRTRRAGARLWIDVGAPLDPTDFADVEQLHGALADIHSELVLESPETLEDPRRAGAWEGGATAEAWVAPERRELGSPPPHSAPGGVWFQLIGDTCVRT